MNKQEHNKLLKSCSVDFGYRCVYCNSSFKKKTTMSNHLGVCSLVHDAPKIKEPSDAIVYSHEQLSRQIEELVKQMRFMNERINGLSLVKKKRITIVSWLNAKTEGGMYLRSSSLNSFEFWKMCKPTMEQLKDIVFPNTLFLGMTHVIQEAIDTAGGKGVVPLRCYTVRPDVLYHFTTNSIWEVCPGFMLENWVLNVGHAYFKLFAEYQSYMMNMSDVDMIASMDRQTQLIQKVSKFSDPAFISSIKKWLKQTLVQEIENMSMIEISVHDN